MYNTCTMSHTVAEDTANIHPLTTALYKAACREHSETRSVRALLDIDEYLVVDKLVEELLCAMPRLDEDQAWRNEPTVILKLPHCQELTCDM